MIDRVFMINKLISILDIDLFTAKNIVNNLDNITIKHVVETYRLSKLFGIYLNLNEVEKKDLMDGALLHDIGKSIVPKDILLKKGSLNHTEFEIMKRHVLNFKLLLNDSKLNDNVKDIVLQHHEKVDGSGYPYNLKGDKINKLAKIFSLIDVYDALVSVRPYKKAFTSNEALELINKGLGCHFDKMIGIKFIEFISHSSVEGDNIERAI